MGLAREALWRVYRRFKQRGMSSRLQDPGPVSLTVRPYYNPDFKQLRDDAGGLIVAYADRIRAGEYRFLGYGTARLGRHPAWNLDFVSGREWPATRLGSSEFIRYDGADVKVPLELSRLQFLPVLGKAYALTGNDVYRQAAKDLSTFWIQDNPAPIGVNWTIAMEAALRAMSVCFLMNLLAPFRPDESHWVASITRSLAQHLVYIEANLEFSHLITSNHYLSNIVGLYCLALFLEGPGMAARRRKYRRQIEAEIMRQVYPDGGDYEASLGYHVLVTQLFTTALLLMRAERSNAPRPEFVARLGRMFRFLATLASASGKLPHVGDGDDGRVEWLLDDIQQMLHLSGPERNSLRVSSLLGLGQRLFGEGTGPGSDAAWYGLSDAVQQPYRIGGAGRPTAVATVLPQSGVGILRHQAGELLFFAIPNGIHGKGSHTHNDKLSFVLRVDGREVICDSGTGCYTPDVATRNRLRSTAAHNTVEIDGREQNHITPGPAGLFTLGNEATVSPIESGHDGQGWYLRASHHGYKALGVTHSRTVHAMEEPPAFVIEDDLTGDGVHDFSLHFQFVSDRNLEISTSENGLRCRVLGEPEVCLMVAGPAPLEASAAPAPISMAYGTTLPALRVRLQGKAPLPIRITSTISWTTAAATPIELAEMADHAQ